MVQNRNTHVVGWTIVTLGVLIGALLAGAGPSTDGETYEGLSRPSDLRQLAFSVRGKVAELLAEPGSAVSGGELLIRLEDTVQRRTVELAELRAEDDSAVRAAESTVAYRQQEYEFTRESHDREGAGPRELREAAYRRDLAEIELDTARAELAVNAVAHLREEARLEEMSILSPIDGLVLEVHKRPGETVDELTPVITVIKIDPLWIDVYVPMRAALGLSVGDPAEVNWQDIDDPEPVRGRIIFKSPAGDGGARRLHLRIEAPNPRGLPSGLHADVGFPAGGGEGPGGGA